MTPIPWKHLLALNLLPLVLFGVVALGYGLLCGVVPKVTPAQARAMQMDPAMPTVLVDVRQSADFAVTHLAGAVNWPWSQIRSAKDANWLPAELERRRLLFICETGFTSSLATHRVRPWGIEALSVRGGMAAWTVPQTGLPGADQSARSTKAGDASDWRPMSMLNQWIVVITAFGVKPLYLLVSFGVVIVLWRRTERDLTALRWGMIWFWFGEQACTTNWLAYGGASEGLDYLHEFGMVTGFAFVAWSVMEGLDTRLIHFSAAKERCAALSLCRRCSKYADEPCGFRRLFLFSVPATAVIALLPLTVDFRLTSYSSEVLGAKVCYSHTMISELFELRLCPLLALLFFAASWLVLLFKRNDPVPWSKLLFAAGLGPLGFGTMRMALLGVFSDDLMWFDTWEEWTELLFVLGVAVVLWIFRQGLLAKHPGVPAAAAATA